MKNDNTIGKKPQSQKGFRSLLAGLALCATGITAGAVEDVCDAFGPLSTPTSDLRGDAVVEGELRHHNFGFSTANLGDFNGDGFEDLAIGAPGADLNGPRSGAVYVFYGPIGNVGALTPDDANLTLAGPDVFGNVGWSVASAGDVDLDGRDDLLIGSLPSYRSTSPQGKAWLVLGSDDLPQTLALDGLQPSEGAVFHGPAGTTEFGSVVAGAGDVDGDGFSDVAIGAPLDNTAGTQAGAVYVFSGAPLGVVTAAEADLTYYGPAARARAGASVAGVGDLDADGFDDLVVGAPRDNTFARNAGAAFVLYGDPVLSGAHNVLEAGTTLYGNERDRLGAAAAAAGDVNHDGYADFWVTATQYASFRRGAAYLMLGGEHLGVQVADDAFHGRFLGRDANDSFGSALAASDFNGDGWADVVVGAERSDNGTRSTGGAWALHGPFDAPFDTIVGPGDGMIGGTQYLSFTGSAVAAFDDLNGDGFGDVVVGGWRNTIGGLSGVGRVSLHLGGQDIADATPWYADADGDGYGDGDNGPLSCFPLEGRTQRSGDCDDSDGATYPYAPELSCTELVDRNCDGLVGPVDQDGDGMTACGGDCDDRDLGVHPGAFERCNDGIDNDCANGVDDDGAVDAVTWYADSDGDGYGSVTAHFTTCEVPSFFLTPPVTVGGDCNDASAAVSPARPEVCDALDNDCDGVVDGSNSLDARQYFADGDGDGFGDRFAPLMACALPVGFALDHSDCDDGDAMAMPGGVEVCDFADNDCDGRFYLGGPVGEARAEQRFLAPSVGTGFADRVAMMPDTDGDGLAELVFTAPEDAALVRSGGSVLVRFGRDHMGTVDLAQVRADGSTTWDARIRTDRARSSLGASVASGDFNGDGFSDLAVGAPGMARPSTAQGAVFVFYGPVYGDLDAEMADVVFSGVDAGSRLGSALVGGDLDGDGFDDLVLTATDEHGPGVKRGAAHVLYGAEAWTSGRIDAVREAVLYGTLDGLELGDAAAMVGDLNGDGAADLAVSASNDGALKFGRVDLVMGTGSRLQGALVADVTLVGAGTGQRLGVDLAGAGDVNGDGLGDLLIGTSRNVAYLVLGGTLNGGASAIAGAADVTFTGDGSSFGLRVGAAGDLNGDGLSDMLIGAHSDDDGGRNAGSAYVVYGAAQMPATVHETQIDSVGRRPVASDLLPGDSRPVESLPSFSFKHVGGVEGAKLVGSTESGRFGYAVGGGYDVNGDGFDDVLVGSTGGIGVVAGASVYYAGPYGMDALAQTEVSFSRSLVVDGERADWLPVQQLETSAGGRASAAVSWDADNLYVGFESVDVLTGGHEHLVVAYFGAGGATSTRSGLALGSQQPTLPFDATHALVWSVDGSTSALATFDGEGWVLDETWTAYGDVVASGEVVEFRLPRTAVGSPTTLEFAAWWVFTGGVGEQSMAAVPANAFEDASYDPNPGHWFRFVLTGAMGPASSPTMPSEQGLGIDALAASMTRYIWDRDVDGRSDDTLAGFDSCPLHLPYRFPQPLDPTLDDDIRPLGIADVSRAVDCDDQDPARYGGAPEIEGDGIDSDCDGFDGFDIEAIAHVSLAEGVLFTDQVAVASAWATDPDAGTDLERPVEYRYTWKVDGVVVPVSGPTLDGAQWFSKGQTVQVAVTVWDGAQISAPVYATAVVVNSLSTTTACDIAPVGETSYDLPISMSSATLDRDSDAVTVSVDWSGAPTVHHFDGHNTIDAFMTGRNSFVWGVCRPHDGERRGYSKFSEAVFVHGPDAEPFEPATGPDTQPPIVLAVEISPKDPREGIDDLEMDAVGWDWERNLATFEYRWYVGNTSTPTHFGKRLPRSAWRPNMYVAGEVRALDEAGNPGPWVRVLATFPSVNHAPHVGGITFFPDRVHALNDITVNTYGGDSDGDTVRNTYEWAVNGVVINGFNHDRLPASYVRDGDMVTVAVTPNDGTEDGDTVAGTIMVDNSQFAPVVTSLTITPVTATEDDDLSVVADVSDPNGDPVTVTFTWSVNGVPVHTGPTLSRIFYTADDVVRVTAQVHDGLLPGHPVSQELVILRVNQPPVIDAIRIDPGTPYVENDLTAVVEAHDPDGDNIFLTYTWRVDGVVLHDVRTDRLPHHRTRNLSEVEVTAVADDGFESSLPATADTTVVNRPPVVTRAVLDPNPAFVDEDIFADVRVTDPDGDPVEVEYVWVVDGLVQHGVTGDTLPASATEVGSSVTVRVTPHDGIVTGAQVTAVAVVANRPPTATVTLMPASPYTTDNLVASSTTADPDGDDVTVRYTWEVDGVVVPGVTGNTLPAAFTRNESRVRVTVTPNDGRMDGTPASTFRDVVNRLPIAMVTLSPTSPTSSDPIVATVSTSDADADPVTLRYRWTVDGAVIFAATTHTLPAAYTRSMSAVEVRVIPNDSYDDGLPVFATTQVGNRPPVVDSVVINPTSPNMDDNLRATATATDPDGDPVTFTFVWTVDGVVVPGVTGRDLPASHTNARSHVVAVATPHDGHEFGREGSGATDIVNRKPRITFLDLSPDVPLVTENVVVTSTAADPDGDPVTVRYQWAINGQIVPFTGTALPAQYTRRGDNVRVIATPNDGLIDGDSETTLVNVDNSPPAVEQVTFTIPDPRKHDDIVSAVVASDPDGDPVTLSYEWMIDGFVVPMASGSTLSAAFTVKGDVVRVRVRATDGDLNSTDAFGQIVVLNTAPEMTSVTVTPTAPTTTEDVRCEAVASDIDAEQIFFDYTWEVDGVVVPGANGPVLPASFTYKHAVVTCTATPHDGTDAGAPMSASTTVVNTPADLDNILLNPDPVVALNDVEVTFDLIDVDGDPVDYEVVWVLDGQSVSTTNPVVLPGTAIPGGEVGEVIITVYDDEGEGTTEQANFYVDIVNIPPVAQCQDVVVEASELTCEVCTSIDDGSYDADNEWLTQQNPGCVDGAGTLDVTLTIIDAYGASDTCDGTVTVLDVTAPRITSMVTGELWPPNHQYETFTIADCAPVVEDNCAGGSATINPNVDGRILSMYSDEPEDENGNGDGRTTDDMVILNDYTFKVRSEREGTDDGRVYGITFEVVDDDGNVTIETCKLHVPHDQSGNHPVIDDGPTAGYSITNNFVYTGQGVSGGGTTGGTYSNPPSNPGTTTYNHTGTFRTQTQGGWGSTPSGGNPGTLLHGSFTTAFPTGLTVGSGARTIRLTSAQAVTDFLPEGGPAQALSVSVVNEDLSSAGVFGGQLVAATVSIAFDNAGITDTTRGPGALGRMVYRGCVDSDLIGRSVNTVVGYANTAISGGSLPSGVSMSGLSDALAAFNENYVDGNMDGGCLRFP